MSDKSEEDKAVKTLIRMQVLDYAERVVSGTASEAQRESVVRELANAFNQWHQIEVGGRRMLETEEGRAELDRMKNNLVQSALNRGTHLSEKNETEWTQRERKKSCTHHWGGR